MPQPKVTIKTLAEQLGVSNTTVARALSHSHKTSQAMIERVNKLADELGYVRNIDGVKLRTGRSYRFAILYTFPQDDDVGDPNHIGMLQGMYERCLNTDYKVDVHFCFSEDETLKKLRELAKNRSVDGVVFDHTQPDDPRVHMLAEEGMPFVTYGRTNAAEPHAFFDIDNDLVAYLCTKALIEEGRTQIALLDSLPKYSFVQHRLAGYRKALDEAGIAYDPSLIFHQEPDSRRVKDIAYTLVHARSVDGFVCVNDVVMMGARAGSRLAGQLEGIGFATSSNTNLSSYLSSPVHTVRFSHKASGWHLADLMLKRLEGAPIEQLQTLIQPELRVEIS